MRTFVWYHCGGTISFLLVDPHAALTVVDVVRRFSRRESLCRHGHRLRQRLAYAGVDRAGG